jgi:hypothetical protein
MVQCLDRRMTLGHRFNRSHWRFFPLYPHCTARLDRSLGTGSTGALWFAPTPWRRFNMVLLSFLFSAELTWSWFFLRALVLPSWLLWAVLSWIEQVCEISRAKLIWVKLLTWEPFLIVRSQTKNYKTQTKWSVLHLLVTLKFWKVLNLENWVCGSFDHEFWGVFFHISYELNL